MRLLLRTPATGLLLALTAACAGSSGSPDPAPAASAKVRIENRSSLNMDIYVRRLNRRIRLGFAPASETVEFALTPAVVAGTGSILLEARPVRAAGRPVLSEPYSTRAGEEIFWSIPPQ